MASGDEGQRLWAASFVAALAAAAIAGAAAVASTGFCVDDAYIHLAYARSLRLGDGFSYNPGDWETGSSSPLWALLLVPFAGLADPAPAVQWLGVALQALTALVTARVAGVAVGAGASPVTAALVAGGLTAAHPGLVSGAISGMEVPLTALLLACSLGLALAARVRFGWAALAGALAVWARPEALLLLAAVCGLLAAERRQWRRLAPALGALAALGCWVGYCLAVSGEPWPNTRYVKGSGSLLETLVYVQVQVVPYEPWLAGLGGAVLIGLHAWRVRDGHARALPVLMLGGWLVAVAATGVTRALDPSVLFFYRRYFIPLSVAPMIAVGVAAASSTGVVRALAIVPVLVAALWSGVEVQARQRVQEDNITTLHVEPARYLATHLPANAVVLVEGAGTNRYFAPRSMRIVDVLGLNDHDIAHAAPAARPCEYVAARPSYALLFDMMVPGVVPLFEASIVAQWVEPRYAHAAALRTERLRLFRLGALTGIAKRHCRLSP